MGKYQQLFLGAGHQDTNWYFFGNSHKTRCKELCVLLSLRAVVATGLRFVSYNLCFRHHHAGYQHDPSADQAHRRRFFDEYQPGDYGHQRDQIDQGPQPGGLGLF